MGAAGFGIPNTLGGFAFKVLPDGNMVIGDTSDDVVQVTGSLDVHGLHADAITENDLGSDKTSTLTPSTSFHILDASAITGDDMGGGQFMHTMTVGNGTLPGQVLDIAVPTSFGAGGNVGIMLGGNVYPNGTSLMGSLPSLRLRWISTSHYNTWIKIGT
tara:strand:+ start:81 stop:557 length:477 start_codon:yes stop_codon:yes gene_type:complete